MSRQTHGTKTACVISLLMSHCAIFDQRFIRCAISSFAVISQTRQTSVIVHMYTQGAAANQTIQLILKNLFLLVDIIKNYNYICKENKQTQLRL